MDDSSLLRRYASERDEAAFAEIVRRHLGLVYGAALRQLHGSVHRAEDVTQSVFADLARKAAVLVSRTDLAGWLYTSTHHAAAKLKRA
jgi:DNA-directed RNA polymerase specialized sigma24 family protein